MRIFGQLNLWNPTRSELTVTTKRNRTIDAIIDNELRMVRPSKASRKVDATEAQLSVVPFDISNATATTKGQDRLLKELADRKSFDALPTNSWLALQDLESKGHSCIRGG